MTSKQKRRHGTPEQVAAQVAHGVAEWERDLALGIRRSMREYGVLSHYPETTALTSLFEENGLPAPDSVQAPEHKVTITYTLRGTRSTLTDYLTSMMPRLYDLPDGNERKIPTVTVVPVESETNPPPARTVDGVAATEEAILKRRQKLYTAVNAKSRDLGVLADQLMHIGNLEPPPAAEYVVMVPLKVTAYDEESARKIARGTLRDRYRSASLGQQDYVVRPAVEEIMVVTPDTIIPTSPDASVSAENPTPEEVNA
jgi:hypothetical protein